MLPSQGSPTREALGLASPFQICYPCPVHRSQDSRRVFEVINRYRRLFARKYCLHPDAPGCCSNQIAAAHTVQRALLEAHLAEMGHVMQFQATHPDAATVWFAPRRIGLREATTFYGFCGKHDCELFRPLESSRITLDAEAACLLAYRAFCRELYMKEGTIRWYDEMAVRLRDGRIPWSPIAASELAGMKLGATNARRNLISTKVRFEEAMRSGEFSRCHYYAVEFDEAPVYMASSAFPPEWDFSGKRVQDLSEIGRTWSLSFSAWAFGGRAVALYAWHDDDDEVCARWARSLECIRDDRLANRILAIAFEQCENVVFRPSWWESLNRKEQRRLMRRVTSGSPHSRRQRSWRDYMDDGLIAIPGRPKRIVRAF
jgi:hypothetical protein